MASEGPSPRQRSLLTYLETFLAERGYAPTLAEMAKALGVSSLQGVKDHLTALERKGYLRRSPGRPRAIELLSGRSDNKGIPILGQVRAGLPMLATENWEGTLPFNPPKHESQAYFSLRITGDSMIGAGIFPGDYVIVRQQDTASPGNIVVALLGEEATVKFLRQHGHTFVLEAANPAYAPIALTASVSPQCILGRVVGLYRHLGESLAEQTEL
jgi:repressor LexA